MRGQRKTLGSNAAQGGPQPTPQGALELRSWADPSELSQVGMRRSGLYTPIALGHGLWTTLKVGEVDLQSPSSPQRKRKAELSVSSIWAVGKISLSLLEGQMGNSS